jgi:serine/threonine-protein kinase
MECIDGMPLSERISNVFGPLQFEEVLHILREVALGLECAHNAAVIHRDLKPANIMLTSYGEVKILDFGLARDMELGQTITKTGETIGTPYYMSPEQFTRMGQLDERSDIYAFGMIAYELVAGKPPFKEGAYHEIALAHLRHEVPPLPKIPEKVPAWFHTFVCVCAEKKPGNRPQSMRELIDFIEQEMEKMKMIPRAKSSDPRWINWLWKFIWKEQ